MKPCSSANAPGSERLATINSGGGADIRFGTTVTEMPRPRPIGNCPNCHRTDITHRVVVGSFTRLVCRMCADSYKRTPGVAVTIEALPT